MLEMIAMLEEAGEEVVDVVEETFGFGQFLNTVLNWCTTTGIKVLVSLIVLFISFKIINIIARKIEKSLLNPKPKKKAQKPAAEMSKKEKTKAKIEAELKPKRDKTLIKTGVYAGKITAKVLIGIGIIGYLGIDTSAIASLIASLGVTVGLAINGALGNIAGGILLLITRPIRVDDYIEALGYGGTVEDVRMVFTVLRTPDNKVVYLPNGALAGASIVNFSTKDIRRVDIVFSVSYDADTEKAKSIILEYAANHSKILKDPAPFARIKDQADSSLDIVSRVWVKGSDYWDVYFDMEEAILKAFDEAGIQIPYNQLDVHVKND